MELKNTTRFSSSMFRTMHGRDYIVASVMLRATYDLAPGNLRPDDDQPWRVSPKPWASPQGPMESDDTIGRGGTDIFVFGAALSPKPVDTMKVTVSVGTRHQHTLVIIGDRQWERSFFSLRPTFPKPFERMPLTMDRAFGGSDQWDGITMPFPANPRGKGYVFAKESAEGKPLPNIEDPRRPVRTWTDNPDPVGLGYAGMTFGPKVKSVFDLDPKTGDVRGIKPLLYNCAFPDMIVRGVRPGTGVQVSGVSLDGPIQFTVPEPPATLDVQVGPQRGEVPVRVDQIGIEPEQHRAFVTWRYIFRYRVSAMQMRDAVLTAAPGGR